MKKTLKELLDSRAAKMENLENLGALENLTEEQTKSFDDLTSEIEALDLEIARVEKFEKLQSKKGGRNVKTEEEKATESFSFLKAMRQIGKGKALDGVEAEMYQEAEREAKESGLSIEGDIALPSFAIGNGKQRTVSVSTEGTNLVALDKGDIIPILEPRLQVMAAGASMYRGLVGDFDLPVQTTDVNATWKAENAASDESTPAFGKRQLRPKRLTAFTELSKQLQNQTSPDVELMIRERLAFAIAKGIDYAAINGSGDNNQPEGILQTSGIGNVTHGTNGGLTDWAKMVELETLVASANGDMGRLSYLIHPKLRGYLKVTPKESGQAIYIFANGEVNGYQSLVSTQLPTDLEKGNRTDLTAAIFGNFEDLHIGQWGGVDIIIDPFTKAKNAELVLTVNSYWDVAVGQVGSFAASKDIALTSAS